MALGTKNLEAQYAKALQIGKTPEGFNLLKQAALGQNDDFDQVVANMALRQLTQVKTAADGVKAQQQLAQGGKQTVRDRIIAEADQTHQLPEMLGIGRLPAPNMEALAAAQGGVVGYAGGGEVAHFAGGGVPKWEDVLAAEQRWKDSQTPWYLPTPEADPSKGAMLEYQKIRAAYEGKKPVDFLPPLPKADGSAPSSTAAAPTAAPAADNRIKAPQKVKDALQTVAQPAVPVQNPTKEQKETLVDKYKGADELYNFISEKFKGQLDPIKDQLAKDRDEYKNMKSENVGLALLGAAGALLKPGRSTASAIGEGLGTLAEYGTKFQPQLLAARQGISAGEIGLAQAEAQAARGNFGTAMQAYQQDQTRALQERELAAKEKLMGQQGLYYGAMAGAKSGVGGTGLAEIKAYQKSLQDNIKSLGIPTSAADKSQLAEWQAELNRVQNLLQSRIKGLNIGDNATPAPGSVAGTYQRP